MIKCVDRRHTEVLEAPIFWNNLIDPDREIYTLSF